MKPPAEILTLSVPIDLEILEDMGWESFVFFIDMALEVSSPDLVEFEYMRHYYVPSEECRSTLVTKFRVVVTNHD